MEKLYIYPSNYHMSTINAKSPCKDLYIYCSSCPIELGKDAHVAKNGIAFLYEFLTYKTTTKTAYKNIMQCLNNLNLVNDIYSSYVWISVIGHTVVFTIDGINLSSPILLNEEESVLLRNDYYVQRFLNFRNLIFSEANKASSVLEISELIELNKTGYKESEISAYTHINYAYIITGTEKQKNPTKANSSASHNNISVADIAYSTLYNNSFVFEDDKIEYENKLSAIPCDTILNIEDFFKVNKKTLAQLLKKHKINEMALFENKFIIYSSAVKANNNMLALILGKNNVFK